MYDEGFTPDRSRYWCDPRGSFPGVDHRLEDLQDMAVELELCIQEEHAMVGQRHVDRHRHVAPADQPRIEMVWWGARHGRVVDSYQEFVVPQGRVGPLYGMIDHDVRDPLSRHVPPLGSPLQETGEAMVRIILSVQHGWTLEEVRDYLETAVPKVYRQVGSLVRRVTRSADHRPVHIDGAACLGDMGADVQDIQASVEIVLLERLLGNDMATEFRNILQQTVQRERP